MIQFVLWKWHQPTNRSVAEYLPEHVDIMAQQIRRNYSRPFRIVCITDMPFGIASVECYPLWSDHDGLANATKAHLPSYYRRLKLYDYATQRDLGFRAGDRIVGIDLDTVIVGNLDKLLETPGRFVGWEQRGSNHPLVYNGSFQMFDCGPTLQHIWSSFDPLTSPKEAFDAGYLGSDQSWLSYQLVGREGSNGVRTPEVVSYPKQAAIQGLRTANRIVFFHGSEKPWMAIRRARWIERFWRT